MRAELKYFGVLPIVTQKLYYSASEPNVNSSHKYYFF